MGITINSYSLPDTFIWKRAPEVKKTSTNYNVSDNIYCILKDRSSTIQIEGIIEGSSKTDVENTFKTILNNVFYVTGPITMVYRGRTYHVYPLTYVKTRVENFPELLKVTLVYGLKSYKEDEW